MSGVDAIRVGTCGYQYYDPGPGWKDEYESKLEAYSDAFPVVELNRTFYELPRVSTAERWRREVVDDFEFTMKAWQAVTHPWSSPTWNGHRDAVPDDRTDEVGYLRPTDFVREAWERTRKRAVALDASVVVVQTPPSFECTDSHESNLRTLLGDVDREGFAVAWEPRGDWLDRPERVERVCEDLDLIHVADPMREAPLADHDVRYARLHGRNEDRYDYDYDYSDRELDELADALGNAARRHDRVFCLFNNYEMDANARDLLDRLDD